MNRISYLFLTLLASAALFTACQKDTEHLVNLSAVIADRPGNNAKVYINGNYGCWQQGDAVKIKSGSNGTDSYSLTVAGNEEVATKATINNVKEGTPYTAGYPGANVTAIDDGTLNIEVPASQSYVEAAIYNGAATNEQRIVCPMAAYSPDGSTLKFYNVAAMLAVTVTNNESSDLTLYAVEVESDKSPLSGTATVTVNTDTAYISSKASTSNNVTLTFGTTVTLAASASKTVYIPVLPIGSGEGEKSTLTVHVKATKSDGTKKYTFHDESSSAISIAQNQIGNVPITLNTSNPETEVNDYFWGQGSEECPFLIENQTDLENLRTVTNAGTSGYIGNTVYYKQIADIELSSWTTAIGNTSSYAFSANYNGGGYSISGINGTALFGFAGSANSPNTIEHLTVSGNITTSNVADRGGLVNNNPASSFLIISSCTTNVAVKSTSTSKNYNIGCGGIIGTALGSIQIEYCENQGNVYCSSNSSTVPNNCSNYGGIVGLVKYAGEIDHCSNIGTIGSDPAISGGNLSCQAFCAGGIIGRIAINSFKVNDCHNNGIIRHTGNRGFGSSGGIVGRVASSNGSGSESAISSVSIKECSNGSDGQVLAVGDGKGSGAGDNTAIGGICGGIYGGSGHIIKECANNGIVSYSNTKHNKAYVGGIIGILGSTTSISIDILNCTNNHAIQGSSNAYSYTGGILGYSNSVDAGGPINIVNCSNKEAVKRGNSVGGIAGYTSRGKKTLQIYNCYSTGEIETSVGTSYAGGMVGRSGGQSTNGLATNCYSSSTITLYDETGFGGAIAGQVSYGTDIVNCYGNIADPYGKRINSGNAGYSQFTGYGTINEVTTALYANLNTWVSTNNGESSIYKTWQQSTTDGNPTELPHF